MFETAELGRKIPKAEFNKEAPVLRTELLEAQQRLRHSDFPVIVLFGGVDAAGKNETVNLLNQWMDPRWINTCAYGPPTEEEAHRPEFWRYTRDLPPKGQIGLFLSAWYSRPILQRVYNEIDEVVFDRALERIAGFEKGLADDGALILKFWMHLGQNVQKKRLKALEKDPLTRWRVTKSDWDNFKHYDDFIAAAERAITRTSTGDAPWQIVEGLDFRYCGLTVARSIRDALLNHLAEAEIKNKLAQEIRSRAKEGTSAQVPGNGAEGAEPAGSNNSSDVTILSQLDMTKALTKRDYRAQLAKYQAKLNILSSKARDVEGSAIAVFEGMDAAGKGGAIRRITAALNARDYRVIPIAAPTDEELAHHYLWRFWRHVSRARRATIFDRSWYGRVLVERVEGFAGEDEWKRAYAEINDFEAQLVEHGILLFKFWMHISPEEQLERFKQREQIAYKRWKLTDEDWRNREKWPLYEEAVNDMVERTSTAHAPWNLIEGNDKRYARVKVLRTICERMEELLA